MILAIDIGGTSTKVGLVKDGKVIVRDRLPTTGHADSTAFVDALVRVCEHCVAGQGQVHGVGIGAPNGNQLTGVIEQAPNLPWKDDLELAYMLSDRLGLPSTLGNDANAAALGEWRYGAGKGYDDLVILTLGTGVGSGLIVNGELVLGAAGNAGELGHTTLVMDGRPCSCGRAGCLETYVSIRGMRQTFLDLGGDADLLTVEGVLPIADAARRGDRSALFTFQWTADWLAVGCANAVAITGPGRLVICGGIAQSGALLFDPLLARFEKVLLNIYRGRVDIVPSGLPPDDAGLLGAAALADVHMTTR